MAKTKMNSAQPPAVFATATAGAIYKQFGISPRRTLTLAVAGRIRCVVEPGRTPRYSVEDAAAVAENDRLTRPAASA